MTKTNCWEVSDCGRSECGREPGGANVDKLGVCPAATDMGRDGINQGKNAGRICWTIAGTLCRGEVQGSMAQKEVTCLNCSFFQKVKSEEQNKFQLFPGMKG